MVGVKGGRGPPGCLVTASGMLSGAALGSLEWFKTKPCREKMLQVTPPQACRLAASRLRAGTLRRDSAGCLRAPHRPPGGSVALREPAPAALGPGACLADARTTPRTGLSPAPVVLSQFWALWDAL